MALACLSNSLLASRNQSDFFIMKMCRTRLTVNVLVDFHSDPGMRCIIRLKENKVDNDKANRESILVDMDGRCNTSFDAVKITNKIHCK